MVAKRAADITNSDSTRNEKFLSGILNKENSTICSSSSPAFPSPVHLPETSHQTELYAPPPSNISTKEGKNGA